MVTLRGGSDTHLENHTPSSPLVEDNWSVATGKTIQTQVLDICTITRACTGGKGIEEGREGEGEIERERSNKELLKK